MAVIEENVKRFLDKIFSHQNALLQKTISLYYMNQMSSNYKVVEKQLKGIIE